MRIDEFVNNLPGVRGADIRKDKRARQSGEERDPFATPAKRLQAVRLVQEAESRVGPLDLTEEFWPRVVGALAGYSKSDWLALTSAEQIAALPAPASAKQPKRTRRPAEAE